MASVMQGDAYNIPVTIKSGNGTLITPEIAACVEITVGQFTKRWPGQVTFDEKTGEWQFPVTQKQTFRFTPGTAVVQARVVFQDGSIMGGSGAPVRVEQSASHGTLPQPEKTEAVTGSAPKATEVTIPTVHDIDVSLHSQVILSDPIKAPYIGDNGNWYEYDAATGTFVDTGTPASGTPPITPDTAGKYLTNNGSKAEWGEVNGTLRVNLNKNSNGDWIIDKTFGEIQKAINDGQVVYVVDTFNKPTYSGAPGYEMFYYDSCINPLGNFLGYYFVSTAYGNIRTLNIYDSGEVSVYDVGVNAVLSEALRSNDVLKFNDRHVLDAATPNVDYALPTLYVTITQDGADSSGNPIYKSDKTYEEIKAAHEAGREVKIARAGMFESGLLVGMGVADVSLIGCSEESCLFSGSGVPVNGPEFLGGQPVSLCQAEVKKDGSVSVFVSGDLETGEWDEDFINKLPQQYVINVSEGADGTMAADWSYDEIQKTLGAYQTDKGGTAVFGVAFEGRLYRMVAGDNKSVVFSDTTPEGISTLTLSQKDGKDVWTHEVVPLGGDNSFKVTLTSKVSGGYDIDKTFNEIAKAYYDNKYVYALFQNKNDFEFLSLDRILIPGVEGYALIAFSGEYRYIAFRSSGGSALMYDKSRSSDNGVRREAMPPVPVTATDNGKFLRVVDGQWAADSIANAKGVSF